MRLPHTLAVAAALGVAATLPTASFAQDKAAHAAMDSADGYNGRIRLSRFLDEPDGYCIDVPGPVFDVQLQLPAIAHTCHFGPVMDQVYLFNAGGNGLINWKYQDHDVCLTATEAAKGAGFQFVACDAPDRQTFDYTDMGKLRLRGTELCIGVERTGPGFGEDLSEGMDAYGRGHSVNAQYTHLKRDLLLEACDSHERSMSTWQAYME